MPITRIDAEPVPYVRPAYEPDTRTLLQLMQMAGQARAKTEAARGQVRAEGIYRIGDILGGGLSRLRQEREAKQAAALEAERVAEDRALKKRDQDIRSRDVEARIRERDDALERQKRQDAERLGDARATAIGYGPMAESDVDTVMQSPSRSGDVRYSFGPGTAEGPELLPTREQQRGIETERTIKAMGGTIGPNGQVVMPPKPEREPNVTRDQLAWLAENGKDETTRQSAARALKRIQSLNPPAPKSDSEPLVQVVGVDGKPIYVPRSQAVGKQPPSGAQKPASGLEKRAMNFFNRAAQADKDLESLEPQIQQLGLVGQTAMATMPNFLQSQLGQQYTQAQRAFTEARLRKDSGAAIPEQEFVNDRKTYFAQPGDSTETLEQKRRARAAVLASLGFESGQALGEYLGDADEASRVVQGYRSRSQKRVGDSSTPSAAPTNTVDDEIARIRAARKGKG